ncbi:glycosyl transferase [Ectocarpus siliculosus]|uniref:Glycosyl transferase n=1 Tax=Ectocarpus siliculosus TaxID=2880 RepID=D8LNA1_ECTSI|nr:glycosyl transferase [Ectocarpus siliculosus]|eukprot:CBN77258.1 glycosyl transferase [Ectocarpus siliculosus]
MGAAQEALLFGKPVLCLPMLADQEDVARRVIDAGAGLGLSGLPTGNISSGDIREAAADIVSDPSYGGSAAVLSGVLRRAGGTLRAADVVEGTLQLGGSSYLHPPELRGPWHEASGTDAYVFLLAGLVLMAVLGYALFAALCYGALLLLRFSARMAVRCVRMLFGLPRRFPRVGSGGGTVAGGRQMGWWCEWWRRGNPRGSTPNGGKKNSDNGVLLSPEKAAAAMAAAAEAEAAVAKMMAAAAAAGGGGDGSGGGGDGSGGGGGGLWDEALMTLLGGPGPPDPFPEDSLPELDGPAVVRQHAPGAGGRNGGNGRGDRAVASGGAGGGNGHLRSLSGELVMWPTAPNDGRTFDFRGWSTGAANGGSYGNGNGNGNDVAPHHLKRWD